MENQTYLIFDVNTPFGAWIYDSDVPMAVLAGIEIPLFAPAGTITFSLLNIIMCLAGSALATLKIIEVLRFCKRSGTHDNGLHLMHAFSAKSETNNQVRFSLIIVGVLLTIAASVLFLLTHSTRSVIVLANQWTAIHIMILAVEIVVLSLVMKPTFAKKEKLRLRS